MSPQEYTLLGELHPQWVKSEKKEPAVELSAVTCVYVFFWGGEGGRLHPVFSFSSSLLKRCQYISLQLTRKEQESHLARIWLPSGGGVAAPPRKADFTSRMGCGGSD